MDWESDAKFSSTKTLRALESIVLDHAPTITSIKTAQLINTDDFEQRLADAIVEFRKENDRKEKDRREIRISGQR